MRGETEREARGGRSPRGILVELDAYHGPLGLLLHLIRSQDIDIFDIPIARITGQFLEVVRRREAVGLDQAGEFLETAAMLLRIKSQMLLPGPDESEYEDPRAELVRRLLEYEQTRELVKRFRDAEGARALEFGKGFVEEPPPREQPEAELALEWEELLAAARGISRPAQPPPVPERVVTVAEKSVLVRRRLREAGRIEFRSLLPGPDSMHASVTLLACLELARRRLLLLRQASQFSLLWIYLPSGPEATEARVGR